MQRRIIGGDTGGVFGNGSFQGSNAIPVLGGVRRYRNMNPHGAQNLRGLGDTWGTDETAAGGADWLTSVPGWIRDIQLAMNTQKLLELNMQRAAQGLPPISSQSIAPTLNFGMSPETQQLVMWGALGIGVVMLINGRKSKK